MPIGVLLGAQEVWTSGIVPLKEEAVYDKPEKLAAMKRTAQRRRKRFIYTLQEFSLLPPTRPRPRDSVTGKHATGLRPFRLPFFPFWLGIRHWINSIDALQNTSTHHSMEISAF